MKAEAVDIKQFAIQRDPEHWLACLIAKSGCDAVIGGTLGAWPQLCRLVADAHEGWPNFKLQPTDRYVIEAWVSCYAVRRRRGGGLNLSGFQWVPTFKEVRSHLPANVRLSDWTIRKALKRLDLAWRRVTGRRGPDQGKRKTRKDKGKRRKSSLAKRPR